MVTVTKPPQATTIQHDSISHHISHHIQHDVTLSPYFQATFTKNNGHPTTQMTVTSHYHLPYEQWFHSPPIKKSPHLYNANNSTNNSNSISPTVTLQSKLNKANSTQHDPLDNVIPTPPHSATNAPLLLLPLQCNRIPLVLVLVFVDVVV